MRAALACVCMLACCNGCDDAFVLACARDDDCAPGSTCGPRGTCEKALGGDAGVRDAGVRDAGDLDGGDAGDGGGDGGASDAGDLDAGDAGDGDAGDVDAGNVDAGPACVDADGDGHGDNCAAGLDCNDGDARRFFGHPEECDGVDNDCNGVADDGFVCACDSVDFGDPLHPYLLCHDERDQASAEAECARRGYALAVFDDAAETNVALDFTFDVVNAWIGLTLAPGATQHRDVDFVWDDGVPLTYPGFDANEPNDFNGGAENCVEINQAGYFNDSNCATPRAYLCEAAPPAPATCTDLDGDGRGDGCALGPDCDDGDASVFALYGKFRDVDGDGETEQVPVLVCAADPPAGAVVPSAVVDCDDRDPSDACPCDMRDFRGRRYGFCGAGFASWDTARSECATTLGAGADLASLDAVEQNWFATTQMNLLGITDPWVGLDDSAVEGTFVWVDGAPLAYSGAFATGEPNNINGGEDCVQIGPFRWNDALCVDPHPYVCELP